MKITWHPYNKTLTVPAYTEQGETKLSFGVYSCKGKDYCNVQLNSLKHTIIGMDTEFLIRAFNNIDLVSTHRDNDLGEELSIKKVDPYTVQFTFSWCETNKSVCTLSTGDLRKLSNHFTKCSNIKRISNQRKESFFYQLFTLPLRLFK